MTQARIQQHRQLFTERNLFLHALLGLLSSGTTFVRFLERTGETESEAPAGGASDSVYLLLGALSLFDRVKSELGRWSSEVPVALSDLSTPGEEAHSETGLAPRELIR
jgi:hypothetical protein